MRYFSTFTGIGGFELGIQLAHEKLCIENAEQEMQGTGNKEGQCGELNNERLHGLTCVGFSEIDKYATAIYQKHFPTHINYGDITAINATELPDFDMLVGGFPCQAFSIAGKRGGFEDTRGTLFFDLARILRAKQPRLFVFENVKGLLSHDNGQTFATIISTLDELGYDLQWQIVNSKNHGVPQNRERVFIVGHLRGTPRPQVFPFTGTNGEDIETRRLHEGDKGWISQGKNGQKEIEHTRDTHNEGNRSKSLSEHKPHTNDIIQLNDPVHSNDRIYSPEGISPTLNTMQGGRRQPFVALSGDGHSESQEIDTDGVRTSARIPRPVDEVSDTQRYRCCGNAVTTYSIRDIMIHLL